MIPTVRARHTRHGRSAANSAIAATGTPQMKIFISTALNQLATASARRTPSATARLVLAAAYAVSERSPNQTKR